MELASALILAIIAATPFLLWRFTVRYKVSSPVVLGAVYTLIFFIIVLASPEVMGNFTFTVGGRVLLKASGGDSSVLQDLGFSPLWMFSFKGLYTSLTSTFLHGSLLHLVGNILFLFLFGVPLENKIGQKRFLIAYFLSGMAASYISGFLDITLAGTLMFSPYKVYLGSSGAIAGIMGVYLYLYPWEEIYLPLIIIITRAPVYVGVLLYLALETLIALGGAADGIGHMAHISGLLFGMVVGAVLAFTGIPDGDSTIRSVEVRREALRDLDIDRSLVEKIINEDNPEVIDAWMERAVEKAVCPGCGSKLEYSSGRLKCPGCGYRIVLYK